jgi:hypothetical protein
MVEMNITLMDKINSKPKKKIIKLEDILQIIQNIAQAEK